MPAFVPKLLTKVPEEPAKLTAVVTMCEPSVNQVLLLSPLVETIVDGSVTRFVHDRGAANYAKPS